MNIDKNIVHPGKIYFYGLVEELFHDMHTRSERENKGRFIQALLSIEKRTIERMKPYLIHKKGCSMAYSCTCGLSDILKGSQ